MLFQQSILISLENLWLNKTRSALTMLGIIIGVGAIIVVFAVGYGEKILIINEVEKFGSNLIVVTYNRSKTSTNKRELTTEEVNAIAQSANSISNVAPIKYTFFPIQRRNKITERWIMGTTADYAIVRNSRIIKGRFITDEDVKKRNKVCVLDEDTVKTLFGDLEPIGEKVRIGYLKFTVVGIVAPKLSTISEMIKDEQSTMLPISIVQKLSGNNRIGTIFAQSESYDKTTEAVEELKNILSSRGIDSSNIAIQTTKDVLDAIEKITKIISFTIGMIAAICLVVGGIGIMNIMLVSVTERTREIGIRKATGARVKDILLQFLIESSTISTIGGTIGIVFGVWVAVLISQLAKWPLQITFQSIMLGFIFSVAIGIFFGLYPAQKAAKLDPVEALRYE